MEFGYHKSTKRKIKVKTIRNTNYGDLINEVEELLNLDKYYKYKLISITSYLDKNNEVVHIATLTYKDSHGTTHCTIDWIR